MTLTLVIGGTRSGKSEFAEQLARDGGRSVRYVATADASDSSIQDRIALHRARRPDGWTTVEAGQSLADSVLDADASECVLVDGLGPWIATALHHAGAFDELSNVDLQRAASEVQIEIDRLVVASDQPGDLIVVAEQAGAGMLPTDPASRVWLDLLGSATQQLAARADRCVLVVAGRPLDLPPATAPIFEQPGNDDGHADLRFHGDTLVRPGDTDHAVNILHSERPAWLDEALRDALADDLTRYPDEREATEALARLHGCEPQQIVPTNGAAEALWLLPAALKPRHAVCIHPAFTETEAALRAHGVTVTRVLRDPDCDFDLPVQAVPEDCDLVVIGNPVSPSGSLDQAQTLLDLRRPGRTLVVDEAFMDMVPGEPESLAGGGHDDVVVVRSLTKSLAVPGLRAGYAIACAALADQIRAVRPPWSTNALALAVLTAAAKRPEAFDAAARQAQSERADLVERIEQLGEIRVWPSVTNFCLVEVPDAVGVAARLRERAIAVRPAGSFPGLGPNHLRLTARSPDLNSQLASALADVLKGACV